MTMKESINLGGGISFSGLLTICFIVLKLTGFITWSWVWVLAPLWIGFALGMGLFAVAFVLYLLFNK